MKCVCGYEKGFDRIDDEYQDTNPNGEDFIRLNPDVFTIEKEGNWSPIIECVSVYACPKCGTLKIEV